MKKRIRPFSDIELSQETADALVLYRDANALYNRIYEYLKEHSADDATTEKRFEPFDEPSKKTLAALLDIVNNNITWALVDGKGTKI